jgi:RsmE family RNA methyltransferase
MNIILLNKEEIRRNTVNLTDRRASHIVKVLKCKVGDTVRVGIVNAGKGKGTILSLKEKRPHCVELSLDICDKKESIPPIDLLLALPRPIMLKRIFSQAAALGVGSITVINANKVEKSFWEAGLLKEESYREHLLHGLEQAMDTRLPNVSFFKRFKPFVEDILPEKMGKYSQCLLAHPYGNRGLKDVMEKKQGRVLLAIGPEGGWGDYEVGRFLEKGFSAFTLGPRILKVDTAIISLHGRISELLE